MKIYRGENEFKILKIKKKIDGSFIYLKIYFTLTDLGKELIKPLLPDLYKMTFISNVKEYKRRIKSAISYFLKKKELSLKNKKNNDLNYFSSGYLPGSGFVRYYGKNKNFYVFEEYLVFNNLVVGGIQDIELLKNDFSYSSLDKEFYFVRLLESISKHWD